MARPKVVQHDHVARYAPDPPDVMAADGAINVNGGSDSVVITIMDPADPLDDVATGDGAVDPDLGPAVTVRCLGTDVSQQRAAELDLLITILYAVRGGTHLDLFLPSGCTQLTRGLEILGGR